MLTIIAKTEKENVFMVSFTNTLNHVIRKTGEDNIILCRFVKKEKAKEIKEKIEKYRVVSSNYFFTNINKLIDEIKRVGK